MNVKKVLPVIAVLVIGVAIGIGAWVLYQANKTEQFNSGGVSFQYAADYQPVDASKLKNKHSETVARLVAAKPLSVIEVKHEKGAIVGAKMAKENFLDYLENTAERSLPTAYDNYKKSDSKRIKVGGKDASRIDFSYRGKDKKTTLYVTLLLVPQQNDAYYAYIQSADKDRWHQDADRLQSSLSLR